MEDHIGEEFDGVISGITNWGIYVELPNTVEGLIHVSRLYDDRYYYKEDTMEMYGVDTGRIFKLGAVDSVCSRLFNLSNTYESSTCITRRSWIDPVQNRPRLPQPRKDLLHQEVSEADDRSPLPSVSLR